MVTKIKPIIKKKATKIPTAGVKRLGLYGGHNTFVKQEKRKFRRSNIPRKHALSNAIEPMAVAILEAERHRNQLCRFNHHVSIDSKGRWVVDDETIKDPEDTAKDYIRAAKGLYNLGYDYTYVRNCATITEPENGEPVSLTLRDAEYIVEHNR
jgi:hypothetical protein